MKDVLDGNSSPVEHDGGDIGRFEIDGPVAAMTSTWASSFDTSFCSGVDGTGARTSMLVAWLSALKGASPCTCIAKGKATCWVDCEESAAILPEDGHASRPNQHRSVRPVSALDGMPRSWATGKCSRVNRNPTYLLNDSAARFTSESETKKRRDDVGRRLPPIPKRLACTTYLTARVQYLHLDDLSLTSKTWHPMHHSTIICWPCFILEMLEANEGPREASTCDCRFQGTVGTAHVAILQYIIDPPPVLPVSGRSHAPELSVPSLDAWPVTKGPRS